MADDPSSDDNVVSFRPRPDGSPPPPPPPLPAGPPTLVLPSSASVMGTDERGDEQDTAASWPNLPAVREMAPPVPVPRLPAVDEGGDDGDEDGAFTLPPPEDPDNPTARDTAAVAMALMTALGVAAAQGMWQRVRHRQALADKARAGADKADKTTSKTASNSPGGTRATRGGGTGGSSGSLLRSPGGEKSKGGRAFGRRTGDGGGGGKAPKEPKAPKSKKTPHGPPTKPGGNGGGSGPKGPKAPKATKDGKAAWWKGQQTPKGSKDGDKKAVTGSKPTKAIEDKRGTKKPKRTGDGKTPGADRLTWKAPKGDDKAKGKTGPKRWASGRADATGKGKASGAKAKGGPGKKDGPGKGATTSTRPGTWYWKAPKGDGKAKGKTGGSKNSKSSKGSSAGTKKAKRSWWSGWNKTSSAKGTKSKAKQGARQWQTPPPPPPGWEGMRPPPWADRTVHVTVEQVDDRPWPRPEAPAITVGRAALTAGPAASAAPRPDARPASTPKPAPAPESAAHLQGAPIVSTPVRTTQYRDADLTIYDVIEADADMAEEITDGVDDARATADGCERLRTKLEEVRAEIIDLKVPGVLAGMLALLMEKTATVQAKAEAIAANLPLAAEAISVAGTNAEARHRSLADAVRDAGHTRPAEREYHDE
ncbi:hypothetical protein ACIBCT_39065 [Streptosporangium sp. NPDC050855]|uniref:hypothetical protein n=1 Tax=Streptosporangium sp. NPDC050855 TaxID=3366194 RepID=UPI0037BCB015